MKDIVQSFSENREIYTIRMAIITQCNLRCQYCYVNFTNNVLNFNLARQTVDILLRSKGEEKILTIYGGEPLLVFPLLKDIVLYAKKEAIRLNKNLAISAATNAMLFNAESLKFFREENLRIAISIDGDADVHNSQRTYPGGGGSYKRVTDSVKRVMQIIDNRNICALMGVHPTNVDRMMESFSHVTDLGFRSINIEPIQGIEWSAEQLKIFEENTKRIIRGVFQKILDSDFFFINTVNRELHNKSISSMLNNECPFFRSIDVYAPGLIGFSHFLLNSENPEPYIIGDFTNGLKPEYSTCNCVEENTSRNNCSLKYADDSGSSKWHSTSQRSRNLASIRFAKLLERYRHVHPIIDQYILKAEDRIFE